MDWIRSETGAPPVGGSNSNRKCPKCSTRIVSSNLILNAAIPMDDCILEMGEGKAKASLEKFGKHVAHTRLGFQRLVVKYSTIFAFPEGKKLVSLDAFFPTMPTC